MSRWRLEKKDPKAAVSEPVQPIVYYLDRGMPEPERTAVRDAALWWNHAFEQAGFRNALVIRDLPAGATFLDARYSGIEWINRRDRAWSIGDSQVDPRTGEILHAVARIDSHRRRTTSRMWRNVEPPKRGKRLPRRGRAGSLAARRRRRRSGGRGARPAAARVSLGARGRSHARARCTTGRPRRSGGARSWTISPPTSRSGRGLWIFPTPIPTDVGSYDRLAIRGATRRRKIRRGPRPLVRAGYAKGIVFPLDSDPRWAEYDWGPDPVGGSRRRSGSRRVILERFGAGSSGPASGSRGCRSVSTSPTCTTASGSRRRSSSSAASTRPNAVAGDGQTPDRLGALGREAEGSAGSAARGARARESRHPRPDPRRARAAALRARARTASDSLRGRANFDRWTAARILAALIVDPLLIPERAARLTLAPAPRRSDARRAALRSRRRDLGSEARRHRRAALRSAGSRSARSSTR